MRERHVVLVGLMGVGKSSTGKPAAEWLGRPYVDSDDEIEARTDRTARELNEQRGRVELHRLEREQLASALARDEPAVIGAAASVVDTNEGRALLEAPVVVWLRADPTRLATEIRHSPDDHRPFDGDPRVELVQQAKVRDPLYERVADAVVDMTGNRERDAAAVRAALERLGLGPATR